MPAPDIVTRLRAAGCVFAEDEARLLTESARTPAELAGMVDRRAGGPPPRRALDGGADGLDVLRRVAAAAPRWLAPGGHLLIEASERQAPRAVEAFAAAGLAAELASSEDSSSEDYGSCTVIGTSS